MRDTACCAQFAVMPRMITRRSRRSFTWLFASCLIALLSVPRVASAVQVTIPLDIDYITLEEALKHHVYQGTAGRAELWAGSDKCQYLYATNPRFERKDG